ncbi:MBL fold metallo-hydrolase [Actinomycetota bacterium Odt1-20B]
MTTNESNETIVLGDVEITKVVELAGAFMPGTDLVPDAGAEIWKRDADWLAPDFMDAGSGWAVAAVQTWVVRTGGRTILVDTGVGNGRERPSRPEFQHLETDFLDRLKAAGVRPEDVDVVVNTHLHGDHVGWNTYDAGGSWEPTFPNASYLVPAADDFHFGPAGGYAGGERPDDRLLYEDSVAPLHRAGLVRLWEGSHRIGDGLTLEAAPGHTPGSSVLRVASGGERAVFVGDMLHSPVQIEMPRCSSCLCADPVGAAETRVRVFGRAAEERELVIPAHFGGAGAFEVRREGEGFAVVRWGVG